MFHTMASRLGRIHKAARAAGDKANSAHGRAAARDEISVLLLEDDPNDADLILRALRNGEIPVRFTCVDTRNAFLNHLSQSPPDLILSDFTMPSFDGYSALQLAHLKCPDVPFIFVTGTLGEE